MSALYFACEWVIRPAVNYVRLVGLAREMGCELAIAQANIVTPDKRVLIRFALATPDESTYTEFVTRVATTLGLDDWQPISAEAFQQAQTLDLQLLDTDVLTKWMDGMHAYGLHNQSLVDSPLD
jgi:hypothetical protein